MALLFPALIRAGEIIGHRGAPMTYPENTLESIRGAYEYGADIAEVDVRLSADGRAVIIHDEDVFRTTGARGKVAGMTLTELKALDAGGAYPQFRGKGLRIPTLEEALGAARDSGKKMILDIKVPGLKPHIEAAQRAAGIAPAQVMILFYPDWPDERTIIGQGLPQNTMLALWTENPARANAATYQKYHLMGVDGAMMAPNNDYRAQLDRIHAGGFQASMIYAPARSVFFWMDAGVVSFWTDDAAGTVKYYRELSSQWNNWADRWSVPEGQRATRFDPDGDGRSNLEEYATGTDPMKSDTGIGLEPVKTRQGLDWTLTLTENWSQFVRVVPQAAGADGVWSDLPAESTTPLAANRLRFRIPEGDPRRFLRVRFELPSQ